MTAIWSLLDRADICIAQNGDSFDFKRINARFLIHRISPPSPYRTIDTLKVAQTVFGFNSNRLNEIGKSLSEGEKLRHRGFEMWKGCMTGKKSDWALMKQYNIKDVKLLERIYLRFRPWIKNHPNLSVYKENECCSKCGSNVIQWRGMLMKQSGRYRRYQCTKCGGWGQARLGEVVAKTLAA